VHSREAIIKTLNNRSSIIIKFEDILKIKEVLFGPNCKGNNIDVRALLRKNGFDTEKIKIKQTQISFE
jgi:hypothetical protein